MARIQILIVTLSLALVAQVEASGAYSTGGGARMSAEYHKGKAIVSGKTELPGCKACHGRFGRSGLKKALPKMHDILTQADIHQPPFSQLYSIKEASAITEYLRVRYRIK